MFAYLLNPPVQMGLPFGASRPKVRSRPARPRHKPSRTHAGKKIKKLLAKRLGTSEIVKHRPVYWAKAGASHEGVRSPAYIPNYKRKKGGDKEMARTKRRKARKGYGKRSHRKARQNPPVHRRRRGHRKHRSNPPAALALSFRGIMAPIKEAGSLLGGYFITGVVSGYLVRMISTPINASVTMKPETKATLLKVVDVGSSIISAVGLSYVVKRVLKKPELSRYVLIGGLIAAMKKTVNVFFGQQLLASWKAGADALADYTVEPQFGTYAPEPSVGEMEETIMPERYASRY